MLLGHASIKTTAKYLLISQQAVQADGDDRASARSSRFRPVPYFHLVFTLPQELALLALQNQKVIYNLLFRAASETLLEIAADRKHLGARIGFLAVLRTGVIGKGSRHVPD